MVVGRQEVHLYFLSNLDHLIHQEYISPAYDFVHFIDSTKATLENLSRDNDIPVIGTSWYIYL